MINRHAGVWMAAISLPVLVSPTIAFGLCPPGWTCDCRVQTPYPPPGAPWGVVNHGSFENGFTNGVGNNWASAWGDFPTAPTYSDSTLRATNGTHSQRINIPEPGDLDEQAGIYQQVYVVPGQTYTLTADVYMELDGSEQFSGQNMVAVVGLDAWGDTKIGEGSIKWSPMQGDKNAWRTLQVSTEAVFEVMTAYVAGWRKYAGLGNGRIWIDNIVLSGPVPTQPPSPPEQEQPDPDADIPDTLGGELAANGSFEGSWSNGLAGNWTSWSTAGSGYWKQSTRIGKIGAGKYDFGEANTVAAMNPKTALTMQMGDADFWGTQANMVDTVIVGRLFIDGQAGQYLSNPEYYGPVHANNCYTEQRYHPRIDCWQGLNEPGWGEPDNWDRVLRFEKAFALRCHELGMKAVVMNMSVGSPGNIWLMLDAQELLDVADYVGYHSYGGPADQLMINAADPTNDPCSFALRWRQYADMYRDRGWRMPPAIYTEGTTYFGWHGVFTPAQIRDDLIAFGAYMNEDRWCAGLTLFVAGGTGLWEEWSIRGQGDIGTACGAWNADHPSEATDGLYSQQFGAGNVHPTTTQEMDNPNGAFTGGVCQQITGLVADSTYLLDLDFRYEFRGLQPQVRFYTGIDPTGQTGNPNAASIDWSSDLVASEPAVHEIWERTWRTFVASGSTVSIWLKAEQTVSNPAYRISVDRVSLKMVDGGATTPLISLAPSSLSPSCVQGTNASSQTFTVKNSGISTLNYGITDNATWLSCTPTSGTSTGEMDTITVNYATSGLGAGTYNATITVSDPNAANNPQTVAVTLTVSQVPACENGSLSNGGFESGQSPWVTFGITDGVVNSGTYSVTAHGGSKMFGAACQWCTKNGGAYQQISVCEGAECEVTAWIYTKQSGGANWDVNCRIGIDPNGGTDAGSAGIVWTDWYNSANQWSQIGLTGANSVTANNDTVTVFIEHWHKWNLTLNVTMFDDVGFTATGGGAPASPTIDRSPATLSPSCTQGGNASSQTFTVANSGGGTLDYSITDNVAWLACSPTSGTSTGEADIITVTYSTSGLSAGTYNGTITISDPNATNNPQTIAVTLTVNPAKITVAEDFNSMPSWTSSYDAGWGGAASWSIVSGGQSGNCLRATRSNTGSSVKVKVYSITANANYTVSVYMRCPSSSAGYWRECAFKLGSHTAQDFDQNSGAWTMIKKFSNDGNNGNGDTWVQYSVNFNSGSNTQISVGHKTGNSSGTAPTISWDTLRIQ